MSDAAARPLAVTLGEPAGIGPDLALTVWTRRRELTTALGSLLEDQATQLGLRLPVPAEDAAVQLLAVGIGLGVQRAFDPELPVTAIVDLLRSLLERSVPA